MELLHQGRLALSYFALRESDGAAVSLKLLQPFANVQEQRDGLAREAELQLRCSHPTVATVLDAGQIDGAVYIARSFVAGVTLAELCQVATRTGARMPDAVLWVIGDALLQALGCVHGQRDADGRLLGLVHRDVTPSNVLIGFDGAVCLTDFGLAHAPALHGALAEDEVAQGTLRYLPPEGARGEPLERRADLFQLAACLAECVGGPLRGRTPSLPEMATEDLRGAVERLGRGGAVLARALSPRVAERFGSAEEMRAAWTLAFAVEQKQLGQVAEWLGSTLYQEKRAFNFRRRDCWG